jgi:hypothetical protein
MTSKERTRWSMREVAVKCDWEGGVDEALRWGLDHKDVPEELEDLWKQMQQAFWAYEMLESRVWKLIDPYLSGEVKDDDE